MTSSVCLNVNITANYSSIYAKHETTDKILTSTATWLMNEMQHKQKHVTVPLTRITLQSHLKSRVQYLSPQFNTQRSVPLHTPCANPRIFKLKEGQEQAFVFADLTTQQCPHCKSKGTGHFTNTSRMSIAVKINYKKPCNKH